MGTARLEVKSEAPSAFGSQNRKSIPHLSCQPNFCLSISLTEDTRAYLIRDQSSKLCVEIRNLKDDRTVQIKEKEGFVMAMVLSPEGDLITASSCNFTRWRNITSQTPKSEPIQIKSPPISFIRCMQFSHTGELISGHNDGSIFSWDLKMGESKCIRSMAKIRTCASIDIDRNGNLTCIDDLNGDRTKVHCWDKHIKLIGTVHTKDVAADNVVRLSEAQVAIANEKCITIWNVKDQNAISTIETKFSVECLSLSPEGFLVANELEGLIEIFDVTTGGKITDIQLTDMPRSKAFWNRFGYLTCVGENAIIDMKCDIQKQVANELSPFLTRDAASMVLPYLFFTPPKKTEEPEAKMTVAKP